MLLLGGAAAAALITPAYAQSKGPDATVIDEVVVTGSLFKQSVTQSQLVTSVSAEEIARTGATSATEALRTIAQNQPITISTTSGGAGTGFASYANLRSLGSASTLVLFNGKRVANNPYQSLGVDLNTIPLNLLDRVETLSDGASSIYGSDAIAGVVNFIPRRELTGLSVAVTRLQPEKKGGGWNTQATISGGIGELNTDGWNVYGGYTWHRREALRAEDRDFSRTNYIPERGLNRLQDTTFPANYSQGTTLVNINPSRPGCNPPLSIFIGPTICRFDLATQGVAIPEMEDQSALVHGALKFREQTFTLEYLRGWSDLSSPQASQQINNATMTPNNPFFPGKGITPGEPGLNPNANITLGWRVLDAGPAVQEVKTVGDRLLGQVDGEVLGLNYQVWGLYSTSTVDYYMTGGQQNVSGLRDGLRGLNGVPFLNPFGAQSAAGAQFLRDNAILGKAQHAKAELTSFGAQVSRALFDLPAGPVQFALAADYKDESSKFITYPDALRAEFFASLTTIDTSRKSYAFTSEVKIPVFDGFDVDASLRYDHSNDFGGTLNPKVLATWKANDWLTLRGSYNTGFRAPTLYNIGAPSILNSTQGRADPVLCPGGVVNTAAGGVASRDCGGVTLFNRSGGNPDLGPEKSKAFSLGLELRPTDNLTISADYWNYHVSDTIAPLAVAAIYADVAKFGDLIIRCSKADPTLIAALPNCAPGHIGDPVAYVEQVPQNLGDTKTDGVDLNVLWSGPDTSWGRLSFDYHGTYVMSFDFQRLPGGPYFSRAGQYFDNFPVLDYSHYAALTWRKDAWTVQLSNRFKNGYKDCNAQCATVSLTPQFHQKVNAYSLWDLSGTVEVGHATVTGRITNLLDTDPPFTNKNQFVGTGWDERFTDPLGRAYSLTVKYDF